jgi:hypothetical protein
MSNDVTEDDKLTIEQGEDLARKLLFKEFAPYIDGLIKTIDCISNAVDLIPEKPLREVSTSAKVVNSLLMKSINDLRAIWILALKGYSIQCATIASSLYESAFTIAYIGNDETLANRWKDHSDFKTNPFGSISSITEGALKKLFTQEEYKTVSDAEYLKYRLLCMAKHSNPVNQRNHVYKVENSVITADSGPETSEHSKGLSCFSITMAIGFIDFALTSYINNHVTPNTTRELIDQIDELRSFNQTLIDQYNIKWETRQDI